MADMYAGFDAQMGDPTMGGPMMGGPMQGTLLSQLGGASRSISMPPGGQKKQEPEEEQEGDLDLSSILNIMDGTLETPGRIIIITSNYPEKLDHAFIRPGRIDMIIEFKKANRAVIRDMFKSFYDKDVNEQSLELIDDYKWTPAEVSQILFKYFNDPDMSIKDLAEYDPKQYFKFSYMDQSKRNSFADTAPTK
jgi:SpoVK/Ycf46/Vps4 family AAA+-type ATPase